jgi:hypothetical protein
VVPIAGDGLGCLSAELLVRQLAQLPWSLDAATRESMMEFDELDAQVEAVRAERSRTDPPEFQLFDLVPASDGDLARVETELQTRLPDKFKEFMRRFGGGEFAFLELLPAVSADDRVADLLATNQGDHAMPGFVAIAPVGTGDYWGFVSTDGVCEDAVSSISTRTEMSNANRRISWSSSRGKACEPDVRRAPGKCARATAISTQGLQADDAPPQCERSVRRLMPDDGEVCLLAGVRLMTSTGPAGPRVVLRST